MEETEQNTELGGLLAEVWIVVLQKLLQPPPDPLAWQASDAVHHQNDLTVIMRVNSTLNALAAPILYKNPYVYHPAEFVRGLGKDLHVKLSGLRSEPSARLIDADKAARSNKRETSLQRFSKRTLLSFTQTLNFLYISETAGTSLESLLSSGKWSLVSVNLTEAQKERIFFARWQKECRVATRAIEPIQKLLDAGEQVFPNLARMSSGLVDDGDWDSRETGMAGVMSRNGKFSEAQSYLSMIRLARTFIALVASSPSLEYFCQHTCSGPLVLAPDISGVSIIDINTMVKIPFQLNGRSRRPVFCYHSRQHSHSNPPILLHFDNVIAYDSCIPHLPDRRNMGTAGNRAQNIGTGIYMSVDPPFGLGLKPKDYINEAIFPKLDIYGLITGDYTSLESTSVNTTYLQSLVDKSLGFLGEEARNKRIMSKRIQEQKDFIITKLWIEHKDTKPGLAKTLLDAITVHPPIDMPTCPGCGFEHGDRE